MIPRDTAQTGVCELSGCARHPASSPCSADPTCRWATSALTSACVKCLCGYLTEAQCWSDKLCQWDSEYTKCNPSACSKFGPNDANCGPINSCEKAVVNNAQVCGYKRCSTTLPGDEGKAACESDSSCLWKSDRCVASGCSQYIREDKCKEQPECYFTYNPNMCKAAQCTTNEDVQTCEQGETETAKKPCIWDLTTQKCRQPTFEEQNAPATNAGLCQKEEYGNLTWLWILAALIVFVIVGIFYRLYVAWKHGLSFFEPARNTKTFSPHAGVGQDVFEEAQRYGEETNVSTNRYSRPTADEL